MNKMAKKTTTERADKTDKPEKGSTSGEKGAGDKTPVENAKENEEQPVELGESMYCGVHEMNLQYFFKSSISVRISLIFSGNYIFICIV